ncbi:MAG: GntR family transcriptional regulator [Gemmatimonadales bacterium]|jgi:GntR family transcriptional regulator
MPSSASDPGRPALAERIALYVDRTSEEPVYRQIVDRVWLEVVTGTLETGARLPTVRQLAVELGVRPDTIERAYRELEELGVLVTRPGGGSFIGLRSPDASAVERRRQLERLCSDVVEQSRALGVPLDEVIDALAERRDAGRHADEGGALS